MQDNAPPAVPADPDSDSRPIKLARLESVCRLCRNAISVGEPMWPVAPSSVSSHFSSSQPPAKTLPILPSSLPSRYLWVHLRCAEASAACFTLRPPPCPHFTRRGMCKTRYTDCVFGHANHEETKCQDQDATTAEGGRNRGKKKRVYTKAGRVACFRDFLFRVFPDILLPPAPPDSTPVKVQPSPQPLPIVLDVAGGKGELAFELCNVFDVTACVVDPRQLALGEFESKFRRFRAQTLLVRSFCGRLFRSRWAAYERRMERDSEVAGRGKDKTASLKVVQPRHLKMFFDDALIRQVFRGDDLAKPCEFANFFAQALDKASDKILVGESSLKQSFVKLGKGNYLKVDDRDAPTYDKEEQTFRGLGKVIQSSEEALHIFRHTRLVAGLHSDGAVEPAIDFAIAGKIAFAVIPCCTCSKDFPKRRTAQGKLVRSYSELVAYLRRKHPMMRSERLEMDGKNVVLFMRPEDFV